MGLVVAQKSRHGSQVRNFQASLVPVASTGNTCHDFSIWYGYPSDRYALPNFRRSRPLASGLRLR
jgi:hypothetical protein